MPKMKTHRGAAKRFKKTGTGKIRRRQANKSHILEKKAPKRKRQLRAPVQVSDADLPIVRRMLGGK
jgi:large subunit ribosomal protein L35